MDIPRPEPEEVHDSYKNQLEHLRSQAINPSDFVYDEVYDAMEEDELDGDDTIRAYELANNPEVKAIIARYQVAREEFDITLMAAQRYSREHLDTLIPEARADMELELGSREAAQYAPRLEFEDGNAEATSLQVGVIEALIKRNIRRLGRHYLLPGNMIMAVNESYAPITDVEDNKYIYSVVVRPTDSFSRSNDGVTTTYYINDDNIEQRIHVPEPLPEGDELTLENLLEQFASGQEAISTTWEMERELGLHQVNVEEAETLSELLRGDWPEIATAFVDLDIPLPALDQLPTTTRLEEVRGLVTTKIQEGASETSYQKDNKHVRVQSASQRIPENTNMSEVYKDMGMDLEYGSAGHGMFYAVVVGEDLDMLPDGGRLVKEVTYSFDPPEFDEVLVTYDKDGNKERSRRLDRPTDDSEGAMDAFIRNVQKQIQENRAANVQGPLEVSHVRELTELLDSLTPADVVDS